MITVNAISVEYLGNSPAKVKVISRGGTSFYKTLSWPAGKPLNVGTIKVEVAKLWKVTPDEVSILENVTIPTI